MPSDRSRSQTRMAKTSAHVGPTSGYKYDVFLNFRGPDTRRTVADVLYESLVDAGISVFRDNEELPVGESIGPELERAIDDSRIYMPIFSEGYASSAWCLQELARMVKRRRESSGHEIVPVFYSASPSDVRLRTGSYSEALLKHEPRYGEETVREWKEALREVADLKGWDARNARLGKLTKDLVRELFIKLKKRQKVLPDHLVGIDDRVRDVLQLLDCGSLDVRSVVLHGMGGVGKTTLAKAIFNRISHLFDGCTFVSNVQESSRISDTVRLQKQLLSDILKTKKSLDVHDVDDGVNMIRERLRSKSVLIVFDNVDKKEQLLALTGNGDWLGPGSRIIVTTRNPGLLSNVQKSSRIGETARLRKQLLSDNLKIKMSLDVKGVKMIVDKKEQLMEVELMGDGDCLGQGSRVIFTSRNRGLLSTEKRGGQDDVPFLPTDRQDDVPFLPTECYAYEMTEMNPWHALQLFSKHAFGENLPPDDLADLSSEIVATTGGLPLALEVLGSFLRDKSPEIWAETLEQLREVPDTRVQERLRMSYDALSFEQKQIFLDVACFFNGLDSKSAKYFWKDCGFFPESGLAALMDISLLKIDHEDILRMHDLIRDFGREIVRENYQNAGSWSRVWESEECLRVLCELIEYQRKSTVESIRLQFPGAQMLSSQKFAALPKLRSLHVDGVKFTGDYKNAIRELRWLSWDHCPADFNATNFSPSNLVVLKLSRSELRNDWPGWHQITKSSKLKVLELEECSRLTRLPCLSALSSLERLIVRNCQRLVELGESIGKLVQLNYLEIDGCRSLRELPEEVGCLKNLKELIMRGTVLGPVGSYLPPSIGNLRSLRRLEMESVGISELPHTIGELKDLKSLCLSRCYELRKLPDSIGGLESLVELDLSYTKVTELPELIGFLRKLKVVRIDHSGISKIPATIGMVEKLEEFHAESCLNLEGDISSRVGSLSFLKILNLSDTRVRSVPPTINQLSHLHELNLKGCHELKRIPKLPPSLINLYVESRSLKTVPNLSNLTDLVNLIVSDYSDESLPNPWDADSVQTPNLEWLGSLSRLETLKLVHKSITAPPVELASLPGLEQLVLSCLDLQSLTQPLPPTLSVLKLISFNSLAEWSPRSDLRYLSSLELCKSWLIEIPINRFGQLENLRELTVSNCAFIRRLACLSGLKKLRVLRLLNCPKLVEIQDLDELESLEAIRIEQCCSLVMLPNLLKSKKLRTMEIRFCRSLLSLPFLSRAALEDCHLLIGGCDKLANHNGPFRLHKYKRQSRL